MVTVAQDPLGEETEKLWKGTAETNARMFDQVFHCVPSFTPVKTWAEVCHAASQDEND